MLSGTIYEVEQPEASKGFVMSSRIPNELISILKGSSSRGNYFEFTSLETGIIEVDGLKYEFKVAAETVKECYRIRENSRSLQLVGDLDKKIIIQNREEVIDILGKRYKEDADNSKKSRRKTVAITSTVKTRKAKPPAIVTSVTTNSVSRRTLKNSITLPQPTQTIHLNKQPSKYSKLQGETWLRVRQYPANCPLDELIITFFQGLSISLHGEFFIVNDTSTDTEQQNMEVVDVYVQFATTDSASLALLRSGESLTIKDYKPNSICDTSPEPSSGKRKRTQNNETDNYSGVRREVEIRLDPICDEEMLWVQSVGLKIGIQEVVRVQHDTITQHNHLHTNYKQLQTKYSKVIKRNKISLDPLADPCSSETVSLLSQFHLFYDSHTEHPLSAQLWEEGWDGRNRYSDYSSQTIGRDRSLTQYHSRQHSNVSWESGNQRDREDLCKRIEELIDLRLSLLLYFNQRQGEREGEFIENTRAHMVLAISLDLVQRILHCFMSVILALDNH